MEAAALPALLLLAASVLLLLFVAGNRRRRRSIQPATTPWSANYTPLKSYPIVGNLPHMLRRSIFDLSSDLLLSSPTGTATVAPLVFTSNPSNVEHIARSSFDNYPKPSDISETLHDFLGEGIFNINGELWRFQRKTASYEFNTKSIRSFVVENLRRECVGSLIPFLKKAGEAEEAVDFQETLDRFAFDNVCSMVFGHDPRCLESNPDGLEFLRAFDEVGDLSIARFGSNRLLWRFMKRLGIGSERRLAEALQVVHGYTDQYVKLRMADKGGDDFLSRFAATAASDRAAGGFSDELLRDMLISFVLAGRDTTPSALTWFFWILCSKPLIVDKIRREVESVRRQSRSSRGEAFSLEELREMQYLHASLSESMRLYPPVPLLTRVAGVDDSLPDGTAVRKGWVLMYNSYAMGRMESIWGEDCSEFKPERWVDENGVFQPASPFKYPVFHGGPRVCMGKELAYIQMKAVAACVIEGFDIKAAGMAGYHKLTTTMKMKGGLPLRFREICY